MTKDLGYDRIAFITYEFIDYRTVDIECKFDDKRLNIICQNWFEDGERQTWQDIYDDNGNFIIGDSDESPIYADDDDFTAKHDGWHYIDIVETCLIRCGIIKDNKIVKWG